MAKAAGPAIGMVILFGAAGAYADTACLVTEICEKCTEDADPGTKLRLYEQHCKDQARASEGYEFIAYHPGPVGQCDFIRSFKTDIDCLKLGLQPAK
jgi:hypothetical protein